MNRMTVAILLGMACLLGGILICLNASNLATHWQMIGPNAWGGDTDPGVAQGYQFFGFGVLLFGIFVLGTAFWRWFTTMEPARSDLPPA